MNLLGDGSLAAARNVADRTLVDSFAVERPTDADNAFGSEKTFASAGTVRGRLKAVKERQETLDGYRLRFQGDYVLAADGGADIVEGDRLTRASDSLILYVVGVERSPSSGRIVTIAELSREMQTNA